MSNLIQTFAALGDETRFAIVERLLKEGELSAGELQEGTEISAPAVSRHLKVLRSAGIVAQREVVAVAPVGGRAPHRVERDAELVARLADEEITRVSVSRPYKFAVGRENQKYERSGNLDGRRLQDIYTIDLSNGKRKLVLEAARHVFDVGPDGVSLLYYKNETKRRRYKRKV